MPRLFLLLLRALSHSLIKINASFVRKVKHFKLYPLDVCSSGLGVGEMEEMESGATVYAFIPWYTMIHMG